MSLEDLWNGNFRGFFFFFSSNFYRWRKSALELNLNCNLWIFFGKNIDQHLNHFVLLKQLSICEPNDLVTSTRLIGLFETPSCGAWHEIKLYINILRLFTSEKHSWYVLSSYRLLASLLLLKTFFSSDPPYYTCSRSKIGRDIIARLRGGKAKLGSYCLLGQTPWDSNPQPHQVVHQDGSLCRPMSLKGGRGFQELKTS